MSATIRRLIDYPSEIACRRPLFAPDIPVRLANDETWHLPRTTLGPTEWGGRGGVTECRLRIGGAGADDVTDAVALHAALCHARGNRTPGPAVVGAFAFVAAALLRANYDLSPSMALVLCRHGFELTGEFHALDLVWGAVAEAIDHEAIERRRVSLPRNPRDQ